jgi:hypothetical protein
MTYEFIGGTYRQTNLTNESDDYVAKREELRLAEIELMQHREKVAALRRSLPQGARLQDYKFLEGPGRIQCEFRTYANRKSQRTLHGTGSSASDLPLDVWQETGQAVPDVHDVD